MVLEKSLLSKKATKPDNVCVLVPHDVAVGFTKLRQLTRQLTRFSINHQMRIYVNVV